MFIYVGCAGGTTSSMFCQRLVKEINQNDKNLTAVFDHIDQVFQKQIAYGSSYDLIFAYGAMDAIRPFNVFDYGQLFDVIFVAPQSSYWLPFKQELLRDYPTIVKAIPSKLFGMMDSAKAYDILLEELIELDLWRAYQSQLVSTTKNSDKNIEIYVAGAGSKDLYFKELFNWLDKENIRCVVQPYTLQKLYDFEPDQDFDVRFIFGSIRVLEEKDFPRVARRIDGFLVSPSSMGAFKNRRDWFTAYQIPYLRFNDSDIKKDLKNGKFDEEKVRIWGFLQKVQMKTEYTTEISFEKLEKKELPKKKSLFGFINWE